MRVQKPCRMSAVTLDAKAECGEGCCEKCGWNPAVNRDRRARLRWASAHGVLHTWGIDVAKTTPESIENRRWLLARVRFKLR